MRAILTDLLGEVTGPKRLENIEVLRITADIMRFVLTLFVHDEFSDPKLFGAILESASHIYYQEKTRKKLLSFFLIDHGIWQDTGCWRDCIEKQIKQKILESQARMKRRASSKSTVGKFKKMDT